jgi:hypothetical protein
MINYDTTTINLEGKVGINIISKILMLVLLIMVQRYGLIRTIKKEK